MLTRNQQNNRAATIVQRAYRAGRVAQNAMRVASGGYEAYRQYKNVRKLWEKKPSATKRKVATIYSTRQGSGVANIQKGKKKGTKKRKTLRSTVSRLKKKVGKLARENVTNHGTTIIKRCVPYQVHILPGHARYAMISGFNTTVWESILSELKYTEFAANATTVSSTNVTAHGHDTKFKIEGYLKWNFRNNGGTPVIMDTYWVKPKHDTASDPDKFVYDGIIANGGASLTEATFYTATQYHTHPSFYPSDSPAFQNAYEILEHKKVRLEPGDEYAYAKAKTRIQNQNVHDTVNLANMTNDSLSLMIRLQGVVSHDSTTTTIVGYADGVLDIILERILKVRHASDVPYVNKRLDITSVDNKFKFATDANTVPTATPVVTTPAIEQANKADEAT